MRDNSVNHDTALVCDKSHLRGGDVLFLISCSQIIRRKERERYAHALVIHASDLPKGRGWSPHIWAVLEGADELVVSLLSAEDSVDSGDIWEKQNVAIPKHYLYDEINAALFEVEIKLMDKALEMIDEGGRPAPQSFDEISYYPRRTPEDGEIDP
ncbi:MAG: formyltransferase family protein, partial [Algiphilus sp.]